MMYRCIVANIRSRIHVRTSSLRFLGIILRVLEVVNHLLLCAKVLGLLTFSE
jgi:hypothetical protein